MSQNVTCLTCRRINTKKDKKVFHVGNTFTGRRKPLDLWSLKPWPGVKSDRLCRMCFDAISNKRIPKKLQPLLYCEATESTLSQDTAQTTASNSSNVSAGTDDSAISHQSLTSMNTNLDESAYQSTTSASEAHKSPDDADASQQSMLWIELLDLIQRHRDINNMSTTEVLNKLEREFNMPNSPVHSMSVQQTDDLI